MSRRTPKSKNLKRSEEMASERQAFELVLHTDDSSLCDKIKASFRTVPRSATRNDLVSMMRKEALSDARNEERMTHFAVVISALDASKRDEFRNRADLQNVFQYYRTRRFNASDKLTFRDALDCDRKRCSELALKKLKYPFTQRTLARKIRSSQGSETTDDLRMGYAVLWEKLEQRRTYFVDDRWGKRGMDLRGVVRCNGPWDLVKVGMDDEPMVDHSLSRYADGWMLHQGPADQVLLEMELGQLEVAGAPSRDSVKEAFRIAQEFTKEQMQLACDSLASRVSFPIAQDDLVNEFSRGVQGDAPHDMNLVISCAAAWLLLDNASQSNDSGFPRFLTGDDLRKIKVTERTRVSQPHPSIRSAFEAYTVRSEVSLHGTLPGQLMELELEDVSFENFYSHDHYIGAMENIKNPETYVLGRISDARDFVYRGTKSSELAVAVVKYLPPRCDAATLELQAAQYSLADLEEDCSIKKGSWSSKRKFPLDKRLDQYHSMYVVEALRTVGKTEYKDRSELVSICQELNKRIFPSDVENAMKVASFFSPARVREAVESEFSSGLWPGKTTQKQIGESLRDEVSFLEDLDCALLRGNSDKEQEFQIREARRDTMNRLENKAAIWLLFEAKRVPGGTEFSANLDSPDLLRVT